MPLLVSVDASKEGGSQVKQRVHRISAARQSSSRLEDQHRPFAINNAPVYLTSKEQSCLYS